MGVGERKVAPSPGSTRCPLCGCTDLVPVSEIPDVPVFCNVLWPSAAAACGAPRGDISLCYCPSCTHLHNRSFDATQVEYQPNYENSLHFSERFNEFASALARRLVQSHDLRESTVVDLGCGRGDFLRLVCAEGASHGIGFDPSYPEEAPPEGAEEGLGVEILPREFGPRDHHLRPDLVCCRHVLEHVVDPRGFVADIHAWLVDHSSETILYFEVPNARYTLEQGGIWDLIYEHHSYFTLESLSRLFFDTGFDVLAAGQAFGGQYIYLEAKVSSASSRAAAARRDAASRRALELSVESFGQAFESHLDRWRHRLREAGAARRSISVWGAGSKGVTFLNAVDQDHSVRSVIDISPRKHGKFVPGTGHRVAPPSALVGSACDTLIVMNPLYTTEIRTMLNKLGITCDIECA